MLMLIAAGENVFSTRKKWFIRFFFGKIGKRTVPLAGTPDSSLIITFPNVQGEQGKT
jgi:hypothetical protein